MMMGMGEKRVAMPRLKQKQGLGQLKVVSLVVVRVYLRELVLGPLPDRSRSTEELAERFSNGQLFLNTTQLALHCLQLTFLAPYFLIKFGCSSSCSTGLDCRGFEAVLLLCCL